MQVISVSVNGRPARKAASGTRAGDLLPELHNGLPVVAALLNNEVVPLSMPVLFNASLAPVTAADPHGHRVMQRTLCLILAKALHTRLRGASYRMSHTISNGLLVTVEAGAKTPADRKALAAALKKAMKKIVADDLPIDYELVAYGEAVRRFESTGQTDKLHLLTHRNPPAVPMLMCGGFYDLAFEPIAPRTGLFPVFDLFPYDDGLVLLMPASAQPAQLPPWRPSPKLAAVFREHRAWGRILGATSAGRLNQAILDRKMDDLVQTAEALHDKKLTEIAAEIAGRSPRVRLVLIAGPSSAGKTTTAKRLCTHLRVNGLSPFLISTDDFFVGDERNPRDADGNLDYEHIEAVDLPRLNAALTSLLEGRETVMPWFDFKRRRGFDHPEPRRLPDGGVIVMEGIHGLNPRLTNHLPNGIKFRLFVSALTQLGIDRNHRISTSDNRLIRRMVRDNAHRGRPARETLAMWPSVQRGEHRWIFPFQDLADAMFNAALDYELAVLKNFAAPLLDQVKPFHPEYAEASRLTTLLANFLPVDDAVVPGYSILRESIGGSQLQYG
ncbi:MAG: nucleoside kinase [Kiritimatiellaeota bacterium]|nr:nucleoside kinase [Kiritimatiellota bacterium]